MSQVRASSTSDTGRACWWSPSAVGFFGSCDGRGCSCPPNLLNLGPYRLRQIDRPESNHSIGFLAGSQITTACESSTRARRRAQRATSNSLRSSLAGWQAVDLVWSGSRYLQTKDLSAGQSDFCDVGHVFSGYIQSNLIPATSVRLLPRDAPSGDASFILDLRMIFSAQPNALGRGHYVLELTAFSENARSERLICKVQSGVPVGKAEVRA
jgi:hypothetical protein